LFLWQGQNGRFHPEPIKRGIFMTTKAEKIAAFFALLAKRQAEHEAAQAQERKDEEDAKLARLKPWWIEAAQ